MCPNVSVCPSTASPRPETHSGVRVVDDVNFAQEIFNDDKVGYGVLLVWVSIVSARTVSVHDFLHSFFL